MDINKQGKLSLRTDKVFFSHVLVDMIHNLTQVTALEHRAKKNDEM